MIALLITVMIQAAPAPAQCAPPPVLAGWTRMQAATAGTRGEDAPVLPIGTAVRATLADGKAVRFLPAPSRPATGRGGVFALTVATAGRYRVALGGLAWIDVARDGKALASVAHAHGPACSGIGKMVDFDLTPGRYVLNLIDAKATTLPVMVVRLP